MPHIHMRTTAFAQVRPAPNATKIDHIALAKSCPRATASSSAIGIDAADVLPYLSMFTNAFSGGMPSFSIARSMMRWFTWCGTISLTLIGAQLALAHRIFDQFFEIRCTANL